MDQNAELIELYSKHWSDLYAVTKPVGDIKPSGPYLCSPGYTYWSSKFRLVFVGQETNEWSRKNSVLDQMQVYTGFELGKRWPSPFWRFIRRIEASVNQEQFSCVALNLNRFDVGGKAPTNEHLSNVKKFDFLLLEELKILGPDGVIFLTGHYHDNRLKELFATELNLVSGFKLKELAQVRLPSCRYKAFRTYHPGYFRKKETQSRFADKLVECLTA